MRRHLSAALQTPCTTTRSNPPFFFFSSRGRHTRCSCDWSSDVCSSDLATPVRFIHKFSGEHRRGAHVAITSPPADRRDRVSAGSHVAPYAVAGDLVLLVKSGLRFSRKAVNASFASSERTCVLNSSFSAFIAALICSRNGCFISLLLALSSPAGFAANFPAVSVALARTSLSDKTWVTRPNSAARLASNGTPNKISSAARR